MSACFHCGLPVPAGAAFGFAGATGEWRSYCCAGCEAVSSAIGGLGLDDYYRLRSAPAAAPPPGTDGLAAYDDAAVQAKFVVTAANGSREATLLLEGLRCAACAWLIERVVARLPGVEAFEANYALRRGRLRWDARLTALSAILQSIRAVGYAAWPYDAQRLALIQRTERRSLLRRLWIAGLGMMQVMMYAAPVYFAGEGDITADVEQLMRWAGLLLTLPVIAYSAMPFFRGALRDLGLRTLGMDVPVALAIVVAFAASAAATLIGRGDVYFDSVTMFVFLLLAGRYLELLARGRAGESLQHLARVPAGGGAHAAVGDRVLVRPGETLPADGILESADAVVNEAWLTGESRPVPKQRGEALLGGSVNDGDAFDLRVTRVGAHTALASIERMMERALAQRPRWVQAAQRASAWFVAAVVLSAVVAGVAWWQLDPGRAVWIAVSVLIVTCPCAFALATPAAVTVATGRLAAGRLVISRAHAIEALAAATDVVFDKTGTLTGGHPELRAVHVVGSTDEARCRSAAAALASMSSHPLDRALATAGDAHGVVVEHHRSVAGGGLEALVDGVRMRLGRADFAAALHGAALQQDRYEAQGDTVAWLADEHGLLARFVLGDALRGDARAAVDALRARGLHLHLLSGDAPPVVTRVATQLGIAHATGGATPADKQDYVRRLQRDGARVAMIGDGINDTPVLGQADVSIAMGGGADIAQLRADAVLLSPRLMDLAGAIDVARRTRRVVRQNVAWSLAYNALAIPLAVAGLVTPVVAAIGMSASSLLVVANALRLRR